MAVNNEMFVVEYSVSQGTFHIETVKDMLKTNIEIALRETAVDYIPLFFTATKDEAVVAADAFRVKFTDAFRAKLPTA